MCFTLTQCFVPGLVRSPLLINVPVKQYFAELGTENKILKVQRSQKAMHNWNFLIAEAQHNFCNDRAILLKLKRNTLLQSRNGSFEKDWSTFFFIVCLTMYKLLLSTDNELG